VVEPEVNMVFARVPDAAADRLDAAGVDFYRMGPGVVRFVTSFQTTAEAIDEVLARLAAALAG
jgi:threonine aldolase